MHILSLLLWGIADFLVRAYLMCAAIALCAVGGALLGACFCALPAIYTILGAGTFELRPLVELWMSFSIMSFWFFLCILGKSFFDYFGQTLRWSHRS